MKVWDRKALTLNKYIRLLVFVEVFYSESQGFVFGD